MSVSGATSFTMNANQIVDKAFNRLGKGTEGEAITARMYTDGLLSLNLLLKSKIGIADHLALRTEGTLALITGQPNYTLSSPFALRVTSVRRRNTAGYDVPLNELSREEYFDTPNKTASQSTPVSYYFDPQQAPVLYLWPAPDATSVTQYTILYTYLRRIDDMVNSTDSLDLPPEWIDPIIWMLADDLEVEYPCNDPRLAMKVTQKAVQGKMMLDGWDSEPASLLIQPDLGPNE